MQQRWAIRPAAIRSSRIGFCTELIGTYGSGPQLHCEAFCFCAFLLEFSAPVLEPCYNLRIAVRNQIDVEYRPWL